MKVSESLLTAEVEENEYEKKVNMSAYNIINIDKIAAFEIK